MHIIRKQLKVNTFHPLYFIKQYTPKKQYIKQESLLEKIINSSFGSKTSLGVKELKGVIIPLGLGVKADTPYIYTNSIGLTPLTPKPERLITTITPVLSKFE